MIHKIITPYSKLENENFTEPVTLVLQAETFNNATYRGGEGTFTCKDCNFIHLTIENPELINFENISIGFVGCFIRMIKIEKITSSNINLVFLDSVVKGDITSSNLVEVLFKNCFTEYLNLHRLKKLIISYTKALIDPIEWEPFFKRVPSLNREIILNFLSAFEIIDCKLITIHKIRDELIKPALVNEKDRTLLRRHGLSEADYKLLRLYFRIIYKEETGDVSLDIGNIPIDLLFLRGSPKGKINIENITVATWNQFDFLPKGETILYNIRPNKSHGNTKIQFYKSDLSNFWFDNIMFAEFDLISFYRINIGKAKFTGCNFPRNAISFEKFTSLENALNTTNLPDNYYKDQYEIYLQLKQSLEASGNFYEAQKLYSISNDALKKVKGIPLADKAILWLNKISNNHGLSIKRPLLWFFIFSIGLYVAYLYSINRIFNGGSIDYSLIGYYFTFIDFTHRSDFLVDKTIFNGWSLFIDYVNKVVTGFFVYQFIAAFRKYGKK